MYTSTSTITFTTLALQWQFINNKSFIIMRGRCALFIVLVLYIIIVHDLILISVFVLAYIIVLNIIIFREWVEFLFLSQMQEL